jgi:D-3-phosphoglycerate dehydrogenase
MTELRFVMAAGNFPNLDIENDHLKGQLVEVRMASLRTPDEIGRETADADGVIVTTDLMSREFIERFEPRTRIIGRAGIGLDTIDLEVARERGIAVLHTPDYATEEVATHALAMILALNRRIVEGDALARRDWMAWDSLAPVKPLSEQIVGVVGLGRIGRAVVERLTPFHAKIIGFDPFVTSAPEGVTLVPSLDALLAAADVVTLHLPLTPRTAGLIGPKEIRLLRSGAAIVNVSRGGLIDQDALSTALVKGRLRAALDVLAVEPPPADAAILALPNVLLSPHFAWYSDSSERRVRIETLDGMLDYLRGLPVRTGRLAVDPSRPGESRPLS